MSPNNSDLRLFLGRVYDDFRTAGLNRKYYGVQLARVKRASKFLEIVIALGTSSALGGWAIWRDRHGVAIWAVVSGLAAVFAVLKPILRWEDYIERYSTLFAGYTDIAYDFQFLATEARSRETITNEMLRVQKRAMERVKSLAAMDDPKPNDKLLKQCYDEINTEHPPETLWLPEGDHDS